VSANWHGKLLAHLPRQHALTLPRFLSDIRRFAFRCTARKPAEVKANQI
jgi:hypothetical protein